MEELLGTMLDIWRSSVRAGGGNRSSEFKQGMLAAIENMEGLGTVGYRMRRCPYGLGSASCDAWFAGVREGKKAWHLRQQIERRMARSDKVGSVGNCSGSVASTMESGSW